MILIRADANEKIGAGHIMRCLSIAKALKAKGEKTCFVTADHEADGLLLEFDHICLDSTWNNPEEELQKIISVIEKLEPKLLLVDSYHVTNQYFKTLRSFVATGYIDDLNADCWDIDILLNYNIHYEKFDYTQYKDTKMLLGTDYIPLRDEFINLPPHRVFPAVRNIFVSVGGADPEGLMEKICTNICPALPSIQFHLVIGSFNNRERKIRDNSSDNIVLHVKEKNMSALMLKCDIAISAAGTTLYELCACGIPTVSFSFADNQILPTETFGEKALMLNAGDSRRCESFFESLNEKLSLLIGDCKLRQEMSRSMQSVIDGNGAYRVATELIGFTKIES